MADQNKIVVTSSPHFFSGKTTKRVMLSVIIAMLPECIYGVIVFGIPALVTILVSVAGAVCFEAIFQKCTKQPITVGSDLSAVVTGILLALVCPPTIPVWQLLLGDAMAIVVAKGFFGGLGSNIWNPALIGRAFMLVSFSESMGAVWKQPFSDAISGATVLPGLADGSFIASSSTYMDYFIGNRAGCIGEVNILLILISFLFLLVIGVIDWKTPVTMVATVAILAICTGGDIVMAVLSGGLVFGAVFMATDYATSPVMWPGKIIFGIGAGIMTFLIRQFGGYPEGVMFSILMMNSITPFLNKIIPHKYGYIKSAKEAKK